MQHIDCGGYFRTWEIREHNYCFMKCSKCGAILGGGRVEKEIKRLMRIKVNPTMRPV